MKLTRQIAKHLREVHFGGNWTASSLRDKLANVTWEQATTRVGGFHTIAALVYHMNYFVSATLKVMHGGPLDAKDKFSFDHPPIASQQDWGRESRSDRSAPSAPLSADRANGHLGVEGHARLVARTPETNRILFILVSDLLDFVGVRLLRLLGTPEAWRGHRFDFL